MYIGLLFKGMFKKNNIAVLLFVAMNIAAIYFIFAWLQLFTFATQNVLYNGLTGIGIYFAGVLIFTSPIGEAFFRWQNKLKPISAYDNLTYVQSLFDEVYAKAESEFGVLPKKIKLYVSTSPAMNAAALGRGTIFLTQGILALPPEQLKGVLAHELAHLRNADTMVLLFVFTGNIIINIIGMIFKFILSILGFISLFASEDRRAGFSAFFVTVIARFLIDTVLILWSLLGLALKNISGKKAEFEADKFAYELGYGNDLAKALQSLTSTQVKNYNPSLFERAFTTHPDVAERIEKCRSGNY